MKLEHRDVWLHFRQRPYMTGNPYAVYFNGIFYVAPEVYSLLRSDPEEMIDSLKTIVLRQALAGARLPAGATVPVRLLEELGLALARPDHAARLPPGVLRAYRRLVDGL